MWGGNLGSHLLQAIGIPQFAASFQIQFQHYPKVLEGTLNLISRGLKGALAPTLGRFELCHSSHFSSKYASNWLE